MATLVRCHFVLLSLSGIWSRSDGGTGVVPKVHEIRQRQGPHPGLGPLLSRVPTDLQAATPGRLLSHPGLILCVQTLLVETLGQTVARSHVLKEKEVKVHFRVP